VVLVRKDHIPEEQISLRFALLRIELAFDVARLLSSLTLPNIDEECYSNTPTLPDLNQTEPTYAA